MSTGCCLFVFLKAVETNAGDMALPITHFLPSLSGHTHRPPATHTHSPGYLFFLWSRDQVWHVGAFGRLGVDGAPVPGIVYTLYMHLLPNDFTLHGQEMFAWASPWYPVVGSLHDLCRLTG